MLVKSLKSTYILYRTLFPVLFLLYACGYIAFLIQPELFKPTEFAKQYIFNGLPTEINYYFRVFLLYVISNLIITIVPFIIFCFHYKIMANNIPLIIISAPGSPFY